MEFALHPEAIEDLDEIYEYIVSVNLLLLYAWKAHQT